MDRPRSVSVSIRPLRPLLTGDGAAISVFSNPFPLGGGPVSKSMNQVVQLTKRQEPMVEVEFDPVLPAHVIDRLQGGIVPMSSGEDEPRRKSLMRSRSARGLELPSSALMSEPEEELIAGKQTRPEEQGQDMAVPVISQDFSIVPDTFHPGHVTVPDTFPPGMHTPCLTRSHANTGRDTSSNTADRPYRPCGR
jgi:hypothetical protein